MPNVVAIPDITGDGIEDLLVGYPASYNAEGAIYVFAGPVSTQSGYLPHPDSAIEVIRAPDNITSLGAKIELLAFSDGISRPDFLVTAQEVVDGENVAVALYMHINKDYLVVE